MTDLGLSDLRVFVRVVERGGFAAAARDLKVPTSTVSRTIARLEERVGSRLLHRTTRSVQPTAEGRALYATVSDAVNVLERAAHALEPATRTPKGTLRVAAPTEIAATFLSDVLVAFGERYPLVGTELLVTNRSVNLVREGYDVALRAVLGRPADSSSVQKKLGEIEHGLYASPSYLEAHGVPASLEELGQHRCVTFRAKDLHRTWMLSDGKRTTGVSVRAALNTDDLSAVRTIVIAGGGIALMPRVGSSKAEAAGQLLRVLPQYAMQGATLYLVYPSAKQMPARVTAFRDFVASAFEAWSKKAAPMFSPRHEE